MLVVADFLLISFSRLAVVALPMGELYATVTSHASTVYLEL